MNKLSLFRWCPVSLFILILVSCNGNGASNSAEITGIAAAGAPITGTAYLKDSSLPAKEISVPVAADGSYSFSLDGLTSPFLLKAVGTVNGRSFTLYSITTTAGITNINPLANLATALANGGDLASLYNLPNLAKVNDIVQALPNAISAVRKAFKPTLAKFGAETINFVSDPYRANHQALDLFLDMADISVANGYVTIVDRTANSTAQMASTQIALSDIVTHSIDIINDPVGAVYSVIVNPNPAVVAPNATLNFMSEVIGSANQQFIWSVTEDNGGTITNSGAYTAPALPGLYHVTAKSVMSSTISTTIDITVSAENILSAIPSGPGVYTVMANNFTNTSAVDFTLNYDTAFLANPRVTLGALATGSMFVQNIGTPGTVRWALINVKPITGSGPLAIISFDAPSVTGKILSIAATLINNSGKVVGTIRLTPPPL
jgi:hypothetical protein